MRAPWHPGPPPDAPLDPPVLIGPAPLFESPRKYHSAGDVYWSVRLKWEPRDLWVGVYWTRWSEPWAARHFRSRQWFICLVPCLPIVVSKRETLDDF